MINKQEIIELAGLVCLYMEAQEIDRISKDAAVILDYINRLNDLNLDSIAVEDKRASIDLRPDIVSSFQDTQSLLNAFPLSQNRFLKVPFVFEQND